MSMLDQHRRQMVRERDKKLRLSREAQKISNLLASKRPKIAKASTEGTRKARQREVDRLERQFIQAEDKVVAQDKAVGALQKKIDTKEDAERKRRDKADAQRDRAQARRDQAFSRDLDSIVETTSALETRLTTVEESSLSALANAVTNDPVQREYDVFLSFATPDEIIAGNLRDELQARGLQVWMADAQVALGDSLVTGIDNGLGSSRLGICFVTEAYIDPKRFWPRQELAAMIMGRKRVIPILFGLEFGEVEAFSSLLGDRKGLSADAHGLDEIAELIVEAATRSDESVNG